MVLVQQSTGRGGRPVGGSGGGGGGVEAVTFLSLFRGPVSPTSVALPNLHERKGIQHSVTNPNSATQPSDRGPLSLSLSQPPTPTELVHGFFLLKGFNGL